MQLNMPQYEMRCSDEKNWEPISEKSALVSLFTNYDRVTPVIDQLFKGKEIPIKNSVFRIRKP